MGFGSPEWPFLQRTGCCLDKRHSGTTKRQHSRPVAAGEAQAGLKQEQAYVRDEFGKILERERISSNEHLTRAILRERAATEEERQKAQRFARQLEEKDRELKKHDAYYKEQLARLEERSAQFYKVTTEQYQKAADEVSARFKRYETQPVCADLQGKILQCYQQHAQETLSCSALASQYLHCVNHAKQSMLGRGG
uniref:Coiled-coil-helix-coiled-coil-helix domain containing 3 n=1 Tax=Meleagris gallopavo TaxID=9103 RepID=A0A803YHS9_MELGA